MGFLSIGYNNGHEYVDLGLPSGTRWAKMNVGATSETEFGNYYTYDRGINAATQIMGGGWYTPTKDQFNELIANTTY
jgi:hypothetical protein